MPHPTPWKVVYWHRCDEWHPKASPYIVDANGDTVAEMPQNVSHPGEYDLQADETAHQIVDSVNPQPLEPEMIHWNNDDKPVELKGASRSWTDDGAPLFYKLSLCPGRQVWTARFEGSVIADGPLQNCMAACEDADRTGEFSQDASAVRWIHEDEAMEMPTELFSAAYKASRVIDGVRMYPFAQIAGVLHAIVAVDAPTEVEGYRCSDPLDV